MLSVHQVAKSFGVQPLFQNVTFTINPGDRVGLIGPNGSGKTTLLEILAGRLAPDQGAVSVEQGAKLGYLTQGFSLDPTKTMAQIAADVAGDWENLQGEVSRLAQALVHDAQDFDLQAAYDRALVRLVNADPGRVAAVFATLGLDNVPESRPIGKLSGGQKTRLLLALLLLREPDLLLLDEPTNHLDIAMLEWLESWLASFKGGVLIVSHDRAFLDQTVNRILAMDDETGDVKEYSGNYTAYLQQYLADRQQQWTRYRDQRYEIRRMRQDIARLKHQAQRSESATIDSKARRYAKKVARKAKSREKKLERYISAEDRVEKPGRSWQMKLDFGAPEHQGQEVLVLDAVAVGYPGSVPLLRNVNQRIRAGQRVVLTGPNGCGKTTLLRTIAGHLPPVSGDVRLGPSIQLGHMTQEQSRLDPRRSALELVQRAAPLTETEARSFLHFFLFSDDEPLRASGELSFGERARLALALLVARGCNFLLLDEPLNHLDIPSRTRFEQALAHYAGAVLAVVHDRYFIDTFASDLWLVQDGGLRHEIRSSEIN